MLRRKLFNSSIIAGAALAALIAPNAFAQTAPADDTTSDTTTTTQPPPAPPAEESSGDEIVITGSRIKTTEFTAPSPVQVLTSEQADLRGLSDAGRFLQSASVAAGSTQIDTKISSAFVESGGPGAQTISLRGLGANRTLVLLNGRRAGPAGTRGGVSAFDLNVIPESDIERIEILKDGASSIYGSDAVAGVVNIITKSDPNGGEIEAFGSIPEEKGGEEYRLNASWGKTFDRAKFSISADYYKRNELRVGDRESSACAESFIFNPGGGRRDLIDPFTGKYQCNNYPIGQIWAYDYDKSDPTAPGAFSPGSGNNSFNQTDPIFLQYDSTGALIGFAPNAAYPAPVDSGDLVSPGNWWVVGRPGAANLDTQAVYQQNSPILQESGVDPRIERSTIFLEGSINFTPTTQLYSEILLNRRVSSLTGAKQFWDFQFTQDYYYYYYNGGSPLRAFIPGGGDPLSTFQGPWLLSPTGIVKWGDQKQVVQYGRAVLGLKGEFGSFLTGWDWDIYGQYSKSHGTYTTQQLLQDAISAQTRIAAFGLDTCEGLILPVSGRVCHDFDFTDPAFMQGVWSQAAKDLFEDTETGRTDYVQKYIEGTTSGNLFDLPAGPVGAAFGFTIRKDSIDDVPGAITLAGNAFSASAAGITRGSDTTKEFFGELKIPIFKDKPLMQDVSLSASARRTYVKTAGDATTYKVGLNWQTTPSFRFRATTGTSFRAPALFENYLASETGSARLGTTDPCISVDANLASNHITQEIHDNCLDPSGPGGGVGTDLSGSGIDATVSSSGGLGSLHPETSKANSFGVVFTPDGSDLSIAIDYFDIRVRNEVTRLGAVNILLGCYSSDSFPADPLCSLFTRLGDSSPALQGGDANNLDTVIDNFINIADQRNRGVDVTARWRHDFGLGTLTWNGQLTWQLQDSIAYFPGLPSTDTNGLVGDPKVVGNMETRFDINDWTFQWSMQYVGPSSDDQYCIETGNCSGSNPITPNAFSPYIAVVATPSIFYHDFSVRKRIDDWTFLVGVANAFDQQPPRVTDPTFNAGAYQTISGTGTLGVSQYDLVGRRFFVNLSKRF
jgi:iron complex outermembrane receptor protein